MFLLSCTKSPETVPVTINLSFNGTKLGAKTLPSTISGFNCLAINVVAQDFPSQLPGNTLQDRWASVTGGNNSCTYPGITSPLFVPATATSISLNIPKGTNRGIQVLGIQGNCPNGVPFGNFWKDNPNLNSNMSGVYELGKAVVNIFGPTTVPIQNTYSSANPKDAHCGSAYTPPSTGVNLVVPVDMIDYGLMSPTGATRTFERSQTVINPTYYDGSPSYSFEIVATNSTASAKSVYLVDSAGNAKATITVSPSISTHTYFSTTFTPNATVDTYRVKIDFTPTVGDLTVTAARIKIKQTQATKTRIYYPLALGKLSEATDSDDINSYVCARSTIGWDPCFGKASVYFRDDSLLATVVEYNFSAIMTTGLTSTEVALYKLNGTQTAVADSLLSVPASISQPSLYSATFTGSATDFVDGSAYTVAINNNTTSYFSYLHKAGLWVRLENLSKAEVWHSLSPRISIPSGGGTGDYYQAKSVFNPLDFSNPQVIFDLGYMTSAGTYSLSGQLISATSAGATTGTSQTASLVTGSSLSSNTGDRLQSPNIISTIFQQDRYYHFQLVTNTSTSNIELFPYVKIRVSP